MLLYTLACSSFKPSVVALVCVRVVCRAASFCAGPALQGKAGGGMRVFSRVTHGGSSKGWAAPARVGDRLGRRKQQGGEALHAKPNMALRNRAYSHAAHQLFVSILHGLQGRQHRAIQEGLDDVDGQRGRPAGRTTLKRLALAQAVQHRCGLQGREHAGSREAKSLSQCSSC